MKKFTGRLALLTMLALLFAQTAAAHQGNPDYRSEILAIAPERASAGIEAEVQNFDDGVILRNDSGKSVLVKGYDGEPYVRISPDGLVEVNLNSPSFYLNQDRFAEVEIPARADPDRAPDWKEVDRSGQFAWHDHRSHYMGRGVPPQVADESVRTKVFDYSIPISVNGAPAHMRGTLDWVGSDSGFPLTPFIAVGLLALFGVGWLLVRRGRKGRDGPDGPHGPEGAGTPDH